MLGTKVINKNDTLNNAMRLSLEDQYLSDLIKDCLLETNSVHRDAMLQEIFNYTEEILRKSK